MSNELLDLFAKLSPRETAGSETAARYDFQTNVSVVKLLELRESGASFCAVFDYFDDLLILDSSFAPTEARFYQIKSKASGSWTAASFCKLDGEAAPRTIISRMYSNIDGFGDLARSIGFISNAQFKFKLSNGKSSDADQAMIVGTDLHQDDLDKLKSGVLQDYADPLADKWSNRILLEKFSHGVVDQEVYVKGRLVKHLESMDVEQLPISALYNVLFSAVRAKVAHVEKAPSSASVIEKKSLTDADINSLFAAAAKKRPSIVKDWDLVVADLISSGVGTANIIRLKNAAIIYLGDCKVGAMPATALMLAARTASFAKAKEISACETLMEVRDILKIELASAATSLVGLDREAALLVEAYGAVHGSDK